MDGSMSSGAMSSGAMTPAPWVTEAQWRKIVADSEQLPPENRGFAMWWGVKQLEPAASAPAEEPPQGQHLEPSLSPAEEPPQVQPPEVYPWR